MENKTFEEEDSWAEFKKAESYLLSKGFKSACVKRDGFLGEEYIEVFIKDKIQVNLYVAWYGFICECESNETLCNQIYDVVKAF